MKLGTLEFQPVEVGLHLIGEPTKKAIQANKLTEIHVSEIDPTLSDTAAFCEHYQIIEKHAVNCVIIEAERADQVWYAACMIPASKRADVNGIIRKELGAKKVSFAPMDKATGLTNMEYGAINPIGLPDDWPILIDTDVVGNDEVIIGSGVRGSKLLIKGKLLATLPNAKVLGLAKTA